MKKEYTKPEIQTTLIEVLDVIALSFGSNDNPGYGDDSTILS